MSVLWTSFPNSISAPELVALLSFLLRLYDVNGFATKPPVLDNVTVLVAKLILDTSAKAPPWGGGTTTVPTPTVPDTISTRSPTLRLDLSISVVSTKVEPLALSAINRVLVL